MHIHDVTSSVSRWGDRQARLIWVSVLTPDMPQNQRSDRHQDVRIPSAWRFHRRLRRLVPRSGKKVLCHFAYSIRASSALPRAIASHEVNWIAWQIDLSIHASDTYARVNMKERTCYSIE